MFRRFFIPVLSLLIIASAAVYSLTASAPDTPLTPFEGTEVTLTGVVVRDPDIREKTIRLTIAPDTVNGTAAQGSARVIVPVNRFTDVAYGSRIRASGVLRAPEAFVTDTGRTFDYPRYLLSHRVGHELLFADVEVVGADAGNPLVAFLLSVKHALVRGIESALPEPHAALAEGLLLGEKQSLGDRLYDAFVASGLVHIIVLSGYNVALVINAVLFISLRTLPRFAGYAVAGVFVVAFAVMTGGSETTIRATIMALFMMVARVLNRPAAALRGLMIAAAAMALSNPLLVLYDLSFQLSVLATFGLIVFSDAVKRCLPFVTARFGLREIVSTTLATQVTVLPLLILSVGAVSLVFLPANVLVLPAVPVAMFLSFISALVTLTIPFLAFPFSIASYVVLAYIVNIATFFGTLPFARIDIPPGASWTMLGMLGILSISVYMVWLWRRQNVPRRRPSSGS